MHFVILSDSISLWPTLRIYFTYLWMRPADCHTFSNISLIQLRLRPLQWRLSMLAKMTFNLLA